MLKYIHRLMLEYNHSLSPANNHPLLLNKHHYLVLLSLIFMLGACSPAPKPLVEIMPLAGEWEFSRSGSEEWHPARVPGTVHTDLLQNGLIPDPFYGCNEEALQWVGKAGWVYRTRFPVREKILERRHVFLVFEGLDTYATVFLNGEPLLQANNMFRSWEADARAHLNAGENLLEIHFEPAEHRILSDSINYPYPLPGGSWVFARKAAYHFGWDWGPRFVTAGIWKPVKLMSWEDQRVEDVFLQTTSITPGEATVRATVSVESSGTGQATLTITDKESRARLAKEDIRLEPGKTEHQVEFAIENPVLWWSNGLGDPHLYELEVEMVTEGGLAHRQVIPYGIRSIEVVTEDDRHGTSFYLKLNGVPVFMKGANYIPQHSFVTEVSDGDYESVIDRAVKSNMNMLRVWGGGIYEQDLFYALCDRNGILVWQDFMFACAMYPGDEGFVENARQEAIQQVRRLRNHASLAMWCGNNEVDEGWHNWGWQRTHQITPQDSAAIWQGYQRVFHELLPGIIRDHDPGRYYLHTSPMHGWGRPESLQQGTAHYWGVWWGMEPFEAYQEKVPRFMSEYGFQAMPALSTIRAFQGPESDYLFSPDLACHQKHSTGYETIGTYLEREHLDPEQLTDYIYLSQLLQANGIGTAIQAHRRDMPRCMGTLYWQFNDCWPVTSWSGTDVFGNWKALQYRVRDLYEDIMVSLSRRNGMLEVHLVSDRTEDVAGTFRLELVPFSGEPIPIIEEFFELPPLSSVTLLSLPEEQVLAGSDPESLLLQASFRTVGERIYRNSMFLVPTGKLQLPASRIDTEVEPARGGYHIHLASTGFAGHVQLYLSESHAWFDDNFFHLWPGETKTVFCASDLKQAAFESQLKVHHLEKALRGSGPAAYVNPFIGTDAHGHTYPGATVPFGMVQLSPDTRLGGWDGASGYHYSDSIIYGFSHTALSGTGVGDYNDILIMPVTGEPVFDNAGYRSPFRKQNEHAEAGYYRVYLDKPGVMAELTATTRAGYHRYTFPESLQANFIIDLQHRDKVVESWIEFVSDTEIRGMRRSSNWANDLVWYFHMEFSKPFTRKGIAVDDQLQQGRMHASGENIKAFVGFQTREGEAIEVKLALSAVDSEGARRNLREELPGWGFDQVRQNAFRLWDDKLSQITVNGGSDEQKTTFYTAMYHALLQPNTFFDVDRRYRGMDRRIHKAEDFDNYTVFSLWDTYRTWHPLMTILDTRRTVDFIRTMMDMYEKGGLLPVWELAANETYTMIGYHSVSVIADAFMKGIRDFDADKALEAMIHSATRDHFGLKAYREHGYIPGDREHESVSKTLEYAYNDWCIAQVAGEMGHMDLYREYIRRAQYYKNIFDPSTGFMRPKLNGGWLTPFDPTKVDWHFTEANSWHYSFYVPQDVGGLSSLHGGKEQLAKMIDELFETDDPITGRDMKDITGLIGQYAQGNEPSHHMAYLYNFVGQPWKTQYRVRQIMDTLYSHEPDGLSGNEDCGQMSAWLIMSAMGFYPVIPGSPHYIIGTPWFPEMEIRLENGNVFRITANNVSAENFYIQSARLNGQNHTRSWISHAAIMEGGHLHFEMGPTPNPQWGSSENDIPVSHITDEPILPVPFIEAEDTRIRGEMEVRIGTIFPGSTVYYTTDGTVPDSQAQKYRQPIRLTETTTLKAIAHQNGPGYSFPVQAEFVKIDLDKSIHITTPWHPDYHGGGPEALIDGVRGSSNWRLGGWHGYQGTDFEAIVDLGSSRPVNFIGAGFIQDIRSWIWMPRDVSFYVSADGKTFDHVATIENTVPIDDYSVFQRDIGTRLQAPVRFIKVQATNFGTIPDWHLGDGGDAYIFIDEIIVE